jgi:hypothetical protein
MNEYVPRKDNDMGVVVAKNTNNSSTRDVIET